MSETNSHIYYKNCVHFTVGGVDQWSERGYLIYNDFVYEYYEDRKEQFGIVDNKLSFAEFRIYARERSIAIPNPFLKEMKN